MNINKKIYIYIITLPPLYPRLGIKIKLVFPINISKKVFNNTSTLVPKAGYY